MATIIWNWRVPVPVDLSKLKYIVKNYNDIVKKDVYNAKIKNIEDEIPDITNLATNVSFNPKIKTRLKTKYLVLPTWLPPMLLL